MDKRVIQLEFMPRVVILIQTGDARGRSGAPKSE